MKGEGPPPPGPQPPHGRPRGPEGSEERAATLETLRDEVIGCRRCPRLVDWREEVAEEKRAAFEDWTYWGRPVPGFGDPDARCLVLGLAPAAHGANRTGRMFTGDRSGDWLFGALHRAGFASRPAATSRHDGLELRGAWVTAPVKCAPPKNRPKPEERRNCRPWLEREVDALLPRLRAVVALGGYAYRHAMRVFRDRAWDVPSPMPDFGHGLELELAPCDEGDASPRASGPITLLCSYHPSQQNTFTGTLTEEMFDEIWERAAELSGTG